MIHGFDNQASKYDDMMPDETLDLECPDCGVYLMKEDNCLKCGWMGDDED